MSGRQIILFAALIAATGHAQSQPERPAVKTTTSGVIIDARAGYLAVPLERQ